MKFDPSKLSNVIEENYSYLMPDFYEMQTEYINSMNNIYKDLDTALVAMFLTNKLYQSENKENYLSNNFSNNNLKYRRFNYTYAVFSINGFTKNAQQYAIAHQIFLIQYYYNKLFEEIREVLFQIKDDNFLKYFPGIKDNPLDNFRLYLRNQFETDDTDITQFDIDDEGKILINQIN